MKSQTIGIIGVGGVGGYFGGKLCHSQNPATSVYFLARGAHLKAIQENGLQVLSEDGNFECHPRLVSDSMDAFPMLDLVLLCVKAFDLESVALQLRDRISANTVILPLLNGVDIYARVRSVIDIGTVLPACVYVGTHILRPGVVEQNGGARKILVGPESSQLEDPKGRDALRVLDKAKILYEWRDDAQTCIWEKFLFIAAFGIVTAAYRQTIGAVLETEDSRSDVVQIIEEILALAAQKGIPLPVDAGLKALEKARGFPYETKTSFQRDFENSSKRDERELFSGAILKMGRAMGVSTPATERLGAQLESIKPRIGE